MSDGTMIHGPDLDRALADALLIDGAGSLPGVCFDCMEKRVEAHVEGQIATLTDEVERERAKVELICRGEPFAAEDVIHFLLRAMLRGSFYLGTGIGMQINDHVRHAAGEKP